MATLTIAQVLRKGIKAHEVGEVEEAERLYKEVLKVQPKHSDANHNIGLLAMDIGHTEKALPFLKTALEADPERVQFGISYITALINLERLAEAQIVFTQIKSKGASGDALNQIEQRLKHADGKSRTPTGIVRDSEKHPPQDQMKSLINLYTDGQMAIVIERAQILSKQYPDASIIWNLMGASAAQIGRLDQAIFAFRRLLAIEPSDAVAHNNMANVLSEQGKLSEALEAYRKALSLSPDYADAYNGMGVVLVKQGKLSEAVEAYKQVLAIEPSHIYAYNNIGNALKDQGEFEKAIEAYSKALSFKPGSPGIYNNIGIALKEQGKFKEAIEAYSKALDLEPNFAEVHSNIATVLQDQGKFDEAIDAYGNALAIKPDYGQVHFSLSALIKYDAIHPQVSAVETLLKSSRLNDHDRCLLHYTYAKMKDDIGDLECAFANYIAGGELRQKELAYDFAQDRLTFSLIKTSAPRFKELSSKRREIGQQIPIFIVGMPRSGTTLIEQIVSSHTAVTGAGELNWAARFGRNLVFDRTLINNDTVQVFRESYLAEFAKVADGRKFLTDKMPQNFLYIALIRAALPEAKIVHVQRKGEAVCWSNFTHYFSSKSLGYSYNLEDTISYFGLYRDLMRFWCRSYESHIYHICYEDLTEHQELETRRLIAYLGLDWEEACLAPQNNKRPVKTVSQKQVRKAIYKGSSQAWRKYEPFLNGVFDGLGT